MTEKTLATLRKVQVELEIPAPAEAVWKALTDAEDLTRWFPLDAKVELGPGGSWWISWGGDFTWDTRIEIWEPNRHLRTTVKAPPLAAEDQAPAQAMEMAVDYYLESRGGVTVLRLVHSGFGAGADWNEEFEATRQGWESELRGLRHYLTHHAGKARHIVWIRVPLSGSMEEAWARFTGPRGLVPLPGHPLREGEAYSGRAATGDAMQGTIFVCKSPRNVAMSLHGMNNGVFRIELYQHTGTLMGQVWLSTWGVTPAELDSWRDRWATAMKARFPERAAEVKVVVR